MRYVVQRCLLQVGCLPWLKPETEGTMRALAKEGHRHVMLVPVSFVNEHVETLHEMDIELGQELAPKVGTSTHRAAPIGDSPCR